MKKTVSKGISHGRIAENRRAKFDYYIDMWHGSWSMSTLCKQSVSYPSPYVWK